MNRTKLILLSGFLGAGKTTLMLSAAVRLRGQGLRVACVTNDQGGNLVDSKMVLLKELPLAQIQGGCFCCRFEDLVESIGRLAREERPEVIIAEAVGSCTDLVATVIKPLKAFHGERLDLAPLTVVADPFRLSEQLNRSTGAYTDELAYLYRKQLEEAQCLVLNKTDLITGAERDALQASLGTAFTPKELLAISAYRPEEVDRWIRHVMDERPDELPAIDIDYDIYASGEAQLGWLNAQAAFLGLIPDAAAFSTAIADRLLERFRLLGMEAAHFKLWAQNGSDSMKLSAVSNSRGSRLDHTTATCWGTDTMTLLVNARVKGSETSLRDSVMSVLSGIAESYGITFDIERMDCFAPGRPTPAYRMA